MSETADEPHILVQDDKQRWYVIPKWREQHFEHWKLAMSDAGQGIWLEDWQPQEISGPHAIEFTGWREVMKP